ncbi:hypothetical protein LSAT2_020681 [Lamellibrachia satsuma]|nr:hypothetical protein LSAT2_020681 [Lamellibrachia satsuma]
MAKDMVNFIACTSSPVAITLDEVKVVTKKDTTLQHLTLQTQPALVDGMTMQHLTLQTQPALVDGMTMQHLTLQTQPALVDGMTMQHLTQQTQPALVDGMTMQHLTPVPYGTTKHDDSSERPLGQSKYRLLRTVTVR